MDFFLCDPLGTSAVNHLLWVADKARARVNLLLGFRVTPGLGSICGYSCFIMGAGKACASLLLLPQIADFEPRAILGARKCRGLRIRSRTL